MALKMRLRQQGCKNRKTYRLVVVDAKSRRDGEYIEMLGWYLPYLTEKNCQIDGDRMGYWLEKGAQMSDQVKALAGRVAPEVLQRFRAAKEVLNQQRIIRKRAKKEQAKA